MYFRRFILGAVAAAPLLAAMAGAAQAQTISPEAAKAFIQQSGQQLVGIINTSTAQAQKADQLRQLVNQIVAVNQVGDYVLGRYLNVMMPQQHAQFQQLFHQNLLPGSALVQAVTKFRNGSRPHRSLLRIVSLTILLAVHKRAILPRTVSLSGVTQLPMIVT